MPDNNQNPRVHSGSINTYYYVNAGAKVEAILRDGFITDCKAIAEDISGQWVEQRGKQRQPPAEPKGRMSDPRTRKDGANIIIKLCGAILSISPCSISRKGRRVLFYQTGRELGRVQPTPGSGCESGIILAAYVEFKNEPHALNLETCVRLEQKIEIESEYLKRFLIITDVPSPDSPGQWVTLMKGWTDKEEQMPLRQLTKHITSKMRHGNYTWTGGKINPDPGFLARMSDDHYRKSIFNELVAEGLLYIDGKRDGKPVYHVVSERERRFSGRN